VLQALEQMTPFVGGAANRYRRGLIVRTYRGVRTVSHSGLWPGFRTEYLRAPELDTAVIAIANHAGIDPGLIAHRTLDMLLDARRAPPIPSFPPATEVLPLAGRYLGPGHGLTLDIEVSAAGAVTLTTFGMPQTVEPDGAGWLAVPRSSSVFAVRAAPDGDVDVAEDAGVVERWVRVATDAVLPDGLVGAYESTEMGVLWTLTAQDGGLTAQARGPVACAGPWMITPIDGQHVRIHLPTRPSPSWLDVVIERDAQGSVTGLVASGSRARGVRYSRRPG
jgi:hypothetical protein